MQPLTKQQKKVLDFLHSYRAAHGVIPTVREIQKHMDHKSHSPAQRWLMILEKKGYLKKEASSWRNIILMENYNGD